jgi:cyclopropane-fatty-acyl-phospholipid synthase
MMREGNACRTIGRRESGPGVDAIEINVRNPRFFTRTLSLGSLGLGESYMDEDYDVVGGLEPLYAALTRNNMDFKSRFDPVFALKYFFILASNRLAARASNIEAHYSLGDDLYELFLDPLLIYTSGYALSKDDDLVTLQRTKLDRICQKLRLEPGETVLDIGCGWGGFLIHAAREYGVRGIGLNINRDQVESGRRRVAQAGLADRIEIRLGDHLSAPGKYDKIATMGLIEHLRPGELTGLFRRIARDLKHSGLAVVHGIGNGDVVNRHDPFVQKYLFPDSNQPLLSQLTRAFELAGLAVLDLENYARSYYLTMRRWGENFAANRHRLDPVRYPPRFMRMWEIYIAWGLAIARYSRGGNFEILVTNDHMRDHPLGRV